MSQALYRKWRPLFWDQVIGQPHVVQTLRNAVAAGRIAHAYLFAGPRGTGKTTTARLLGKAVNCLWDDLSARPCNKCAHCQAVNQGRFLDLIEIDAASNTSVEDIRDLRDKINFSPNQGRYKVYVIDEVHMLSTAAFNALLKTLEEPPAHAIFILATTEIHKIPATVLSRCQRHEFRRIPLTEMVAGLKLLATGEKIQVETEALTLIARQATGSMRDAISLLDQLASSGKPVTLELAHQVLGTVTSQAVLDVIEALLAQDAAAGLEVIHRTLDAGSDPRQFARQVVDYLRGLLLVAVGSASQVDVTAEMRPQMARHAQAFGLPALLQLIEAFNRAAAETRSGWQPSLPLEIAFVEALAPSLISVGGEAASTVANAPRSVGEENLNLADKQRTSSRSRPSETPAGPRTSVSDQQRLDDNWHRIQNLLKERDSQLGGLIEQCRSHVLKGSLLILTFNNDVLQKKMEKGENIDALRAVVHEMLGLEVSIRCHTLAEKRNSPPPGVDSDGMVASAVRDLGGEIVDIQGEEKYG